MPANDPVRQMLINTLNRQLEALEECQHENGLWPTLLLDSSSYVEASCTAGFAFGILKAVRHRYVEKKYLQMGLKAVEAVIHNIDEKGELQNVSARTAMGMTKDFYKKIPITGMPYGQSMAILCLVEYLYFNI